MAVIGSGSAGFIYDSGTDTFEVCAAGEIPASARVAGTWSLEIAGMRGTVPYSYSWTSSAYVVHHCVDVPRAAPHGSLTLDFAYTAAGVYVVVQSVHTMEWSPATGNVGAGTDVSR